MSLYRGAGGASDATDDSTVNAVAGYASSAASSATAAATSATNASNNASASAASASNSSNSAYQAQVFTDSAQSAAFVANTAAGEAFNNATLSNIARGQAQTAAGQASTYSSQALGYRNTASTHATNAANSSATATSQATAAGVSAAQALAIYGNTTAMNNAVTSAATSATTATTQATNAASSATAAASSASSAASAVSSASSYADSAQNSANDAQAYATSALSARDATLAAYDSFDDRYLGVKSAEPTVDNDGNPLVAGSLYFNDQTNMMMLRAGSAWVAAYTSGGSPSFGNTVINGTLGVTGAVTLSGGTANGVPYLNGSKVLTTGSDLAFDGTNFLKVFRTTGFYAWGSGYKGLITDRTSLVSASSSSVTTTHLASNLYFDDTVWRYSSATNAKGSSLTQNNGTLAFYATAAAGSSGNVATTTTLFSVDNTGRGTFADTVVLSGGTANGVPYLNGSKVLTTGSALVFDGTNLGVGAAATAIAGTVLQTTGTTYAFNIVSDSTATVKGQIYADHANDVVGIGSRTNHPVIFQQNNSEQMRLTSTGLGIGTSSPGQKLDVVGNIRAAQTGATALVISNVNTPGTSYSSQFQLQIDGTYYGLVGAAGYAGLLTSGSAAGDMVLRTNSRKILFTTNDGATTSLTLDSSGNLGLGVTPSAWSGLKGLQNGRASLAGQSSEGAWLTNNAYYNGTNWVYMTSSQATMYQQLSGVQSWHTAASGTAGNAISFTQAMTLDASGRLGVGTTSPTSQLHVVSSGTTLAQFTGAQYSQIRHSDGTRVLYTQVYDNQARLFTESATPLLFGTGDAERMRLDPSGNLGLGVTPSASTLKMLQGPADFVIGTQSNGLYLANNAYYNAGWKYAGGGAPSRFSQDNGAFQWHTAASGTAGNAIPFTQAMTLAADGNLLVGTTTSSGTSGRLHVAATAVGGEVSARIENLDSTNAVSETGLRFMFNGALKGYIGTIYGSAGASSMYFYNNGAERARIDNSGNLLVGTTSGGITNSNSVTLERSSGAYVVVNHSGTVSGDKFAYFNYNGSGIGSITQNGTTAVAYNTSSDYRLKENIQPMTGALAKVAALKPCTYKWKADGSDGEGFIAHELAEVVPQCVTGEKDAVDEEGKPVYQGIDTSFLVATLTAAIQEQQAIINDLRARVAQLESN